MLTIEPVPAVVAGYIIRAQASVTLWVGPVRPVGSVMPDMPLGSLSSTCPTGNGPKVAGP